MPKLRDDITDEELRARRYEIEGVFPLSFSSMDRYDQCPRWWGFEGPDRLGRQRSDAGDLGTALHEYMQTRATEGADAADQKLSSVLPLEQAGEYKKLRQVVDGMDLNSEHLLGVEVEINWSFLVGETSVEVRSYADFLSIFPDDHAELIDLKSGRMLELDVQDDVQLKMMALGIIRQYPHVWRVDAWQYQLRFSRWSNKASWTAAELEEFAQVVETKAQTMINDQERKPSPGLPKCVYCPFTLKCDAALKMLPKGAFEMGNIKLPISLFGSEGDLEKIAAGLVQLKAIVSTYEEALRVHVRSTKTPIEVDGKTWDFHKSISRKVAPGQLEYFIALLQNADVDVEDLLSINGTKIKPFLNPKNGKHMPELNEAMVNNEYSKWGYRKAGEVED
jgi:hypothetical protein